MKHGLVRRAGGHTLAFAVGILIAVALAVGAQAHADTIAPSSSLSIEPEAGYEGAVVRLSILGVINRVGDPHFAGPTLATRVQIAVYLARVLHLPDGPIWNFADVSAARWGYVEIGEVCEAGLMRGTSSPTFSPDAPVSRQEAAALIVAALRHSTSNRRTTVAGSLTFYQVDSWSAGFQDRARVEPRYSESVASAYRLGLFDMPAGGWLLPELSLTYQELTGLLDRAFVAPLAARAAVPTPVDAAEVAQAYPKLSKGSTGALVNVLQQRLNALHYPCGEPDGKYASQTRDAVLAFQKYERLKRTGYVDQGVWEALFAASPVVPVFQGGAGRRVEVDLTRQIMMLIQDDAVLMTVHVSTGKFGTPTGNWHIRTRSHGWRMCSLGLIYSPSYFMPRNAIHGYPSVPTYPASHGCIRTPIWIQDEIVDQLEMGELVHVFYNKAR